MRASETDERIESSFKNDAVKAEAKNGVVTLTGTVADESHKVLAEETAAEMSLVTKLVEDVHGVTGVKNQMTVE